MRLNKIWEKSDLTGMIGIIIAGTYLIRRISVYFDISSVVGWILWGMLLNNSFRSQIGRLSNTIRSLGDVGLIVLMFISGVASSHYFWKDNLQDTVVIALFGMIVPFLLGFTVMKLVGFSTTVALITGICLAVTAESTNAQALLDSDLLESNTGSVIMGAGLIDDTIGVFLFALVIFTLQFKRVEIREFVFLALMMTSFISGLFCQDAIKKWKGFTVLKETGLLLLVPFFFVSVGTQFHINFRVKYFMMVAGLLLIAILGKVGGVLLTQPLVSLTSVELQTIGWGMNSRGAIGNALLLIALRNGIIQGDLYSALVLVTIITMLMFPFFLKINKPQLLIRSQDPNEIKKIG